MPATGFQAFILCGPGESLHPFNSNPVEFPKALIPIANRPMVWYPLEWCYRMGVTNISLIIAPESKPALEASLNQNPHLTSLPSPRPQVLSPEELTLTTGTAELFRIPEIQNAIDGNFIVLPCDLVSELSGASLLETWMTLHGDIEPQPGPRTLKVDRPRRQGGLVVHYQTKDAGEGGVGVKGEETDFLVTTPLPARPTPPPSSSLLPHVRSLAMSMPTAVLGDYIAAQTASQRAKGLEGEGWLRPALLRKHGGIRLLSTHRDAHVYLLPHWVKEFMRRNGTFESVGEDVLGWWAKAGWQAGLSRKLSLHEALAFGGRRRRSSAGVPARARPASVQGEDAVDLASLSSTSVGTPAGSSTNTAVDAREAGSPFASRVANLSPALSAQAQQPSPPFFPPPLHTYLHPAQPAAALLRRVDTAQLLLSTSLFLAKLPATDSTSAPPVARQSPLAHAHKIHPSTTLPAQLSIRADGCLVDANVRLSPKSTISESVIGSGCVLASLVRLGRCVLMEGASVEEKAVLNGCVLGRRCRIGKGVTLTDCFVEEGYVVREGTSAKGEVFAGFDEEGEDGDGVGFGDEVQDFGGAEEEWDE